jgi:cytochrome c oxidase subunit 5b
MLVSALRAAARPAVFAARASFKPTTVARAFSVTARARSGHAPAPQIFGEGGKAGQVPTDFEQATGLERLQLLAEMEGVDIFSDSPDTTRLGTKADPIKIVSYVRV